MRILLENGFEVFQFFGPEALIVAQPVNDRFQSFRPSFVKDVPAAPTRAD